MQIISACNLPFPLYDLSFHIIFLIIIIIIIRGSLSAFEAQQFDMFYAYIPSPLANKCEWFG